MTTSARHRLAPGRRAGIVARRTATRVMTWPYQAADSGPLGRAALMALTAVALLAIATGFVVVGS